MSETDGPSNEPPQDEKEKGQVTLSGCLLMVLSVAVIGGVALVLVRWRDPETGQPLPRMVAIFTPVIAGALVHAAGAAILKFIGLPIMVKPETDDAGRAEADEPDHRE
jgi:hypothetical protein